jgi:hypothetical protein
MSVDQGYGRAMGSGRRGSAPRDPRDGGSVVARDVWGETDRQKLRGRGRWNTQTRQKLFQKTENKAQTHIHMAAGLFFSFTRLFCFFFVTRGHPSTYIFILLAAPAKCGFPPLWPLDLWGSSRRI